MQHIKSLDGIRAFAVSLVILFHYGYVPFGWIGVQIFFVLSGYLITSILCNSKNNFSFTSYIFQFYWRRSLRIFPLYFFVLLAAYISYLVWQVPGKLPYDLPYLLTYTTNLARLREQDIGAAFIHLWSLAVEEQFYLLWPIFLFAMPQRYLKKSIILIVGLSPIIRIAVYCYFRDRPEIVGRAIYCLPFTQFDSFAFGAAIVFFNMRGLANSGRWFVGLLTLAGILGVIVVLYEHFLGGGAFKESLGYALYLMPAYGFVWGYSLIGLVSMIGIVCALQQIPAFGILENRLLTYVGKISYGIYIFHIPMLMAVRQAAEVTGVGNGKLERAGLFVAYCAAVLIISAVSFRWLESPFLRLKDKGRSQQPAVAAATPL